MGKLAPNAIECCRRTTGGVVAIEDDAVCASGPNFREENFRIIREPQGTEGKEDMAQACSFGR
jgi:hypothetical protein